MDNMQAIEESSKLVIGARRMLLHARRKDDACARCACDDIDQAIRIIEAFDDGAWGMFADDILCAVIALDRARRVLGAGLIEPAKISCKKADHHLGNILYALSE